MNPPGSGSRVTRARWCSGASRTGRSLRGGRCRRRHHWQGRSPASVDDPIKNREQAFPRSYRDRIWDWLQFDAMTCLAPDGVVILTATRWHDDDPCGRFLKAAEEAGGEPWEVLSSQRWESGIPDEA